MKIIRSLIVFVVALMINGCAVLLPGLQIDKAIDNYHAAATNVNLGDSKERVLSVLQPTQVGLSTNARKQPEAFLRDGKRIDIYYFRSRRQPDYLTTDDEFTPYVFTDGILTGIGWQALGGPKSTGQTTPETNIHIEQKKPQCTTACSASRGCQSTCY